MFAIITSTERDSQILYGPFVSAAAAEKYAKAHEIWGICIVVRLHDSGEAMDYA